MTASNSAKASPQSLAAKKKTAEFKVCVSSTTIRVRPKCLSGESEYSADFLVRAVPQINASCPPGPAGNPGIPGTAGKPGTSGPQGNEGQKGQSGISPSTIVPSGETIFGVIQDSREACQLNYNSNIRNYEPFTLTTSASYGAILPSPPIIEVAQEDLTSPHCKGSATNPIITPGYVCVYVTHTSPFSTPYGVFVFPVSNPENISNKIAFTLGFQRIVEDFNSGYLEAGLAQFAATWFYKAP